MVAASPQSVYETLRDDQASCPGRYLARCAEGSRTRTSAASWFHLLNIEGPFFRSPELFCTLFESASRLRHRSVWTYDKQHHVKSGEPASNFYLLPPLRSTRDAEEQGSGIAFTEATRKPKVKLGLACYIVLRIQPVDTNRAYLRVLPRDVIVNFEFHWARERGPRTASPSSARIPIPSASGWTAPLSGAAEKLYLCIARELYIASCRTPKWTPKKKPR